MNRKAPTGGKALTLGGAVRAAMKTATLASYSKSVRLFTTKKENLVPRDFSTLGEFLSNGSAKFCSHDGILVRFTRLYKEYLVEITAKGELTFYIMHDTAQSWLETYGNLFAIVPATKPRVRGSKLLFMLVLNADCFSWNPLDFILGAASFRCLGRFFVSDRVSDDELTNAGRQALQQGEIWDATPDTIKKCDISPSDILEAGVSAFTPPAPGFTLVRQGGKKYVWHRPGSFLIGYKDKKVLLGQDEGTYFGCELFGGAETIPAAYKSLVPPGARNRKYKRQGEWFAVPVSKGWEPKLTECLAFVEHDHGASLTLPVESQEANRHTVEIHGEVRVTREGIFANNFTLKHEQHAYLRVMDNKWYRFLRNTAIRSFSEAGVD